MQLYRIRQCRAWLWEVWPIWLILVVLLPLFIISFVVVKTEPSIRLSGMFLQIMGVLAVIHDISKTRRYFGSKSIFIIFKEWILQCPLFRRDAIAAGVGIALATATASARSYVTANSADESIESRISAVEKNIHHLHDRINSVEHETDQCVRDIRKELQDRKNNIVQIEHELKIHIREISTNGLSVTAVGAAWILCGQILSGASVEMAKFFN